MKHTIIFIYGRLLALIMLITMSVSAFAADGDTFVAKTIEGIDMTFKVISEEEKTCQVGMDKSLKQAIAKTYAGIISIPDVVNGYSVIRIGDFAFAECGYLTNVFIPNTIIDIGRSSFAYCNKLSHFSIPNTVTTIGNYAFYGCTGFTSITIPNSVSSIGATSFAGCENLVSVTIGYSLNSFGENAFKNCNNLQKVVVQDLTMWCKSVFYDEKSNPLYYAHHLYSDENTEITELIIPDDVTIISSHAFAYCTSLTSVTNSKGVTKIGDYSFSNCNSLNSIKMSYEISNIGNSAFKDCEALDKVIIPNLKSWCNIVFEDNDSNPLTYAHRIFSDDDTEITNLIIPDGVTHINDSTFIGCNDIKNIIIPNTVTSIGNWTFSDCENLVSIEMSTNLQTIGSCAFDNCKALSSISIPYGVDVIQSNTFGRCIGLKKVELPSSVISIEDNAFYNCYNLSDINLPSSLEHIGNSAFRYCEKLNKILLPKSITSIEDKAFYGCQGLFIVYSLIEEPFEITSSTFPGSTSQITLYIPHGSKENYESMEWWNNAKQLIEVYPKGTLIKGNTQEGIEMTFLVTSSMESLQTTGFTCQVSKEDVNLTSVSELTEGIITIPNVVKDHIVTAIGTGSFYGCSKITSIIIPKSVSSIGNESFSGCTSLTDITIHSSVTSIGDYAFYNCSSLMSVAIPNNVTSIGSYAFKNCKALTDIILPNSITSIAMGTFEWCSGLTNITIPNSVQYIYQGAFQNCSGLTQVSIPNSVVAIEDEVFSGCTNLATITLPNTLEKISKRMFAYCTNLTAITIPKTVRFIENQAFSGCSRLLNIDIPNSVQSIANKAFYGCKRLTNMTLPASLSYLGEQVFLNCDDLKNVFSLIEEPFVINDNVFASLSSTSLYIPWGLSEKYNTIEGWNKFMEMIEMYPQDYVFTGKSEEGILLTFKVTTERDKLCTIGQTCQLGINDISALPTTTNGKVTIPNIINHCTVTGIGQRAFANCSSIEYVIMPNSVINYGDNMFEGCSRLAALDCQAEIAIPNSAIVDVDNSNLLLYVKDRSYAPTDISNIVVNDKANEIVLSDAASGNNFYCPQEFTAERISYVHNYSMQSGYNECRGWETIVLPFDVTLITNQAGAELVPRSAWTVGSSQRPFFLYGLTDGEWQPATSIKANTPYIISMPNNDHYSSDYCLTGDVEFRGVNVKVHPSDQLAPAAYGQRKLIPTYTNLEASQDIFALNVNNLWSTYGGTEFAEGSTFIRNMRSVHPFEAYMTMEGSAARAIPIFDDADITGIGDAIRLNDKDEKDDTRVYNLAGQQVQTPVKGLYIINGKKVIK